MPGNRSGAGTGLENLLKIFIYRVDRIRLGQGQLCMAEDHAEHVVIIMGDPARQLSDRFHLLGLTELLREVALDGDVCCKSFDNKRTITILSGDSGIHGQPDNLAMSCVGLVFKVFHLAFFLQYLQKTITFTGDDVELCLEIGKTLLCILR